VQRETGLVRVAGVLEGLRGTFSVTSEGDGLVGRLLLPGLRRAFDLATGAAGELIATEVPITTMLCFKLPPAPEVAVAAATEAGVSAAAPVLSSRPAAQAVLYIDFDGEIVTDPDWNGGQTIVAAASPLSATQITEVWQRVKEDFLPFNIDVTTDRARYDTAPARRRMRCIVTPTSQWFGSAGGVAYINSFNLAGTSGFSTDVPCWVFNSNVSGIAEAISHEFGHTLGLDHDGDVRFAPGSSAAEYYAGHGSGAVAWAPIMGVGYSRALVQWSRGEYTGANNTEDDVALISRPLNGFGYAADEAGNTLATAAALPIAVDGAINFAGVISSSNDVDVYTFTAPVSGSLVLSATPAALSPNLDLRIELLDASGNMLLVSNPDLTLAADLSRTLTAGVYYVRVQGTGRGSVSGDGYSAYGSIGHYGLSGALRNDTAPTILAQPKNQTVSPGATVTFSVTASGTAPLTYQWSRDGVALADATHASLTLGNVQPAHAGSYTVVVANSVRAVTSAPAVLTVQVPPGVIAVSAGARHTAFLRADGSLWTMGANDQGQLGDGTTTARTQPVQVASSIVHLAAGSYHTLYVAADGTLWGMGSNSSFQLGSTNQAPRLSPAVIASDVAYAAAGNAHSLFIKRDGTLWAVGSLSNGLGDGTPTAHSTPMQIATGVVLASAGGAHSAFLRADGTAWTVGDNSSGQLGDGTTISRLTPVQVATQIVALRCGPAQTFFLDDQDRLFGCGYNYEGAFGTGVKTDHHVPVALATDVVEFAPSQSFNAWVKTAGVLWTVGSNTVGQLGRGTTTFMETTPLAVATDVHAVAVSHAALFFVKRDGSLWATGSNVYGQFGRGNVTDSTAPVQVASGTVAVPLAPLVVASDATHASAVRLTWSPVVGAAGYEVWRATTNSTAIATRIAAHVRVTFFDDRTAVVGTTYHYWVKAMNAAGSSSFGTSDAGSKGAGTPPVFAIAPRDVAAFTGAPVDLSVQVTGDPAPTLQWQRQPAGSAAWTPLVEGATYQGVTSATLRIATTPAMRSDRIRCVATNDGGATVSSAALLSLTDAAGVVAATMGARHSFLIRADGSLWAAGANDTGQLGDGTTEERRSYTPVASDVVAAAAGEGFSLALKRDGTLWSTGANGSGQLGDGTQVDRSSFAQIATNVRVLSAGRTHALFLDSDGKLWGMGDALTGALGLGTGIGAVMTPRVIATDVTHCAAAEHHSLFIKLDGAVWVTGRNSFAQLGIGSNADRMEPTPVATNARRVSAGVSFNTFLKVDGAPWAMGNNSSGQFGNGSGNNSTLPVPTGLTGALIATGRAHTLLQRADGSVWGHGLNSSGQLGRTSSLSSELRPVLVAEGVAAFAAGGDASMIVTADGAAWTMGNNQGAQLGDGTTATRFTPTRVAMGAVSMPLAPHSLAASRGAPSEAIRLVWEPVLGAQSYEVWRRASFGGSEETRVGIAPEAWFHDRSAVADTRFTYRVRALNAAGASGFTASATGFRGIVPGPPVIVASPESASLVAGEVLALTVGATDASPLIYQWRKDGTPLPGRTEAQIAIGTVGLDDSGSYDVVVSNPGGDTISSVANVIVVPRQPPIVVGPPSTKGVALSEALTLEVSASGTPPLAYQWFKDGRGIPGATASTWSTAAAALLDSGTYSMTVRNAFGIVSTSGTRVRVATPAPAAAHETIDRGYMPGGDVTVRHVINHADDATALTVEVVPPSGWKFHASQGDGAAVKPSAGETLLLEWRWAAVPASPVIVSYTLRVPSADRGLKSLITRAQLTANGVAHTLLAAPDPLVMGEEPPHSADVNRDRCLDLSELTRVIELFNTRHGGIRTGAYRPASATEDGFEPDAARPAEAVVALDRIHAADADRDGRIDVLELTRVIQLYNHRNGSVRSGRYRTDAGSADGFAPAF
jgi:alpha-tubulin suppressor-like RCC1 family protein